MYNSFVCVLLKRAMPCMQSLNMDTNVLLNHLGFLSRLNLLPHVRCHSSNPRDVVSCPDHNSNAFPTVLTVKMRVAVVHRSNGEQQQMRLIS